MRPVALDVRCTDFTAQQTIVAKPRKNGGRDVAGLAPMELAQRNLPQLPRAGIPQQQMVVTAPHSVFDLSFSRVQLPLDASHIVRLKLAEQATDGVIRHGLPGEQFLHAGPERAAAFTGHPKNAAWILSGLLPTLARPFTHALAQRRFG